jgi:quinol monooxygenase YgiN
MQNMMAVAIFPKIAPENLEQFKAVATKMLEEVNKQDSILRYDMFFTSDNRSCVVLEEYRSPDDLFEHVKNNSALLDQLTALGGKIEGSIFPMSSEGQAIADIRANWDAKFHTYFSGKPRK